MTDNSLLSPRIHRPILLVSVLLVASIAVSAYFGSLKPKATRATVASGLLEFSIELDKTEFIQQGERVNITFSLINTSNKTIKLDWSSFFIAFDQTFYFDFYIMDANGTRIYQWSYGHGRYMGNSSVVLNPSERVTSLNKWPQVYGEHSGYDGIVPKGTYSVAGCTRWIMLTIDGQVTEAKLETPTLSFTIT